MSKASKYMISRVNKQVSNEEEGIKKMQNIWDNARNSIDKAAFEAAVKNGLFDAKKLAELKAKIGE
jgi:hypothetical protein